MADFSVAKFSEALIETCDTHMSRSSGNTKFEFDCRYKIKYFSKLDAFKQRSYFKILNARQIVFYLSVGLVVIWTLLGCYLKQSADFLL